MTGLRFRKWAERVDVLRRAAGDCTAGGVSGRFDSLWVIGPDGAPDGWQPRPTDPTPILQLVERRLRDIGANEVSVYYHVEPLAGPTFRRRAAGENGPMMGGNFVHSPTLLESHECVHKSSAKKSAIVDCDAWRKPQWVQKNALLLYVAAVV